MVLNPAHASSWWTVLPPEPKNRHATPAREQIDEAYALAQHLDPDLDVFLATAALTGLRRQAHVGCSGRTSTSSRSRSSFVGWSTSSVGESYSSTT